LISRFLPAFRVPTSSFIGPGRGRCAAEDLLEAAARQLEQLVQPAPIERAVLASALHLDVLIRLGHTMLASTSASRSSSYARSSRVSPLTTPTETAATRRPNGLFTPLLLLDPGTRHSASATAAPVTDACAGPAIGLQDVAVHSEWCGAQSKPGQRRPARSGR